METNNETNQIEELAETTKDIPDYELGYTAEDVDAAIGKAHRTIANRVRLTSIFAVTSGLYRAGVTHDLSAYRKPVCVAMVDGDYTADVSVLIAVSKTGVEFTVKTSDTSPETRNIHYIIMEGS